LFFVEDCIEQRSIRVVEFVIGTAFGTLVRRMEEIGA